MNNFGLMHSRIIEKNLQGMAGFTFEEHARFLIRLTEGPRFIFTRSYQDKGVDGYIRKSVKVKKENKTIVEVFSIFGKEAWTQPDKQKITKDLLNAVTFAKDKGWDLKKWNLIVNFELETDFKIRLDGICKGQGILFEEWNPTALVTKINGRKKIFEAACFFNAVEAPSLPYSGYSHHELAKRALLDLADNQNSSTDKQLQLLKEIVSTIQKISFIDKKSYHDYISVMKHTKIHTDYIFHYKFFEGYFLPTEEVTDQGTGSFSLDENKHYVIKVMNLVPILSLCKILQKQVEKTGTYNIQETLKIIHNSSLRYNQIKFKKTGSDV